MYRVGFFGGFLFVCLFFGNLIVHFKVRQLL